MCDHPERHEIDETLVTGAPYRSVAKRFGLSESAVYRHKTEHLPVHLLKAREVEEVAQADDLLEQVRHLQAHVLDILERADRFARANFDNPEAHMQLLESIGVVHASALTSGRFIVMALRAEGLARAAAMVEADYLVRDPRPGDQQDIMRVPK